MLTWCWSHGKLTIKKEGHPIKWPNTKSSIEKKEQVTCKAELNKIPDRGMPRINLCERGHRRRTKRSITRDCLAKQALKLNRLGIKSIKGGGSFQGT